MNFYKKRKLNNHITEAFSQINDQPFINNSLINNSLVNNSLINKSNSNINNDIQELKNRLNGIEIQLINILDILQNNSENNRENYFEKDYELKNDYSYIS